MNIFENLFRLNVNSQVEKKNGLNYLSWTYAWAEVKKLYPQATYEVKHFGEKQLPYVYDENTGYMVFTEVTIEGLAHEMWLPVMDGANKAMKNEAYTYEVDEYVWENRKKVKTGKKIKKTVEPATMFDINKTIMRCLAKNLAMFGLGLYIYSGEDLPEVESKPQPKKDQLAEIKSELNGLITKYSEISQKSIPDITKELAGLVKVKLQLIDETQAKMLLTYLKGKINKGEQSEVR